MAKVWKIAPGKGADHWDMCRRCGCIVIGWAKPKEWRVKSSRLRDYRKFKTEQEILRALNGAPGNGKGAAHCIWRFVHEIQKDDIVIANKGERSVVGVGLVKSEYLPPSSSKNPSDSDWLPHARLVEWFIDQPITLLEHFFTRFTISSLTADKARQVKRAYLKKYPRLKNTLDQLFDNVSAEDAHDSPTKGLLAAAEQQLTEQDAFDPAGIKDARDRILSSIVQRRGQPAFRKHLLAAYKGRCAITGCGVEAILEAAHIVPYKGSKTNHVGNGLLLRADLHTLFDLRLVAVDARTMRLMVAASLEGTGYEQYRGKRVWIPDDPANRPSKEALRQHERKSRLSR